MGQVASSLHYCMGNLFFGRRLRERALEDTLETFFMDVRVLKKREARRVIRTYKVLCKTNQKTLTVRGTHAAVGRMHARAASRHARPLAYPPSARTLRTGSRPSTATSCAPIASK